MSVADVLTEQHLENKPLYDYRNKVFVPFEDNIELQAIAHAYAKATAETMVNLSKTKMLRVCDKNGRFVKMQKGYCDILDRATMQVASGATDFHTAMRRIETGVREQNSMKAMYQASGNTAAVKRCNERIKRYQDKYKEISGITGIAQDKKCMTLTGADKIKSTSTSKAVKTIDNSAKSDIINNIKSKQGVQDVHYIGKIDKNILEKEFGKINTSEVVLTDERKLHIQERHPNDYAIFEKHSNDIITKPDIMLKDSKNENTVFAIKHIEDTNLNIIVKLSIGDDTKHPKNSIMSAYRIRDKNVKKLIKKNKVLYKSE